MGDRLVPGTPELIRQINRTLLLDAIRREGPLSRSALAARSGISLPAVSRAVADLLGDGWVSEIGAGSSSGGRRPILLRFNPRAGFVISVDVTPARLLGGVADLSGDLTDLRSEVPAALGPPLLEQVAGLIGRLADSLDAAGGPLAGIGLAVPGIPDRAGETVSFAPAIDWQSVPAGRVLRERFRRPVSLQNDVNAMLLAEHQKGAAVGLTSAVAVAVGAGVGAAVLLDGRLCRGRDGAAGEIGFWLTDPAQEPRSGTFGHLESLLTVTQLARRWAEATGWQGGPGRPAPEAALAASALAGESPALEMVTDAARLLGMVMANLVTLLNPEAVILCGEALRLEPLLLPECAAMVARQSPFPAPVLAAQLGEQAALIGAVFGVLEGQRSSVSYVGSTHTKGALTDVHGR